jgi:hypothetical protein
MSIAHYQVCVPYRTVKGTEMQGGKYPCTSETATHAELRVPNTGERVVFSKSEVKLNHGQRRKKI